MAWSDCLQSSEGMLIFAQRANATHLLVGNILAFFPVELVLDGIAPNFNPMVYFLRVTYIDKSCLINIILCLIQSLIRHIFSF